MFGRNTTGGAILFSPKKPEHEFGGYVMVGAGNYDNREIEGALNLPLIQDKLAIRLTGNLQDRDGYTKNYGVGGDLDAVDSELFRASVLFEPNEHITNNFIYDSYKSSNEGTGLVPYEVVNGSSLLKSFGLYNSAIEAFNLQKERGVFSSNPSFDQYENLDRTSIVNRTELSFNDIEVVNIFGYRDVDLAYAVNASSLPLLTADGTGSYPKGAKVHYIPADLNQNIHQYSNELQFKGDFLDDKADWMIGFFWLKSEPSGPQGNSTSFGQIDGAKLAAPTYSFVNEESKSIFMHSSYDLSAMVEGLEFEAGVRYSEDDIESCIGVGTNTSPGPVYARSDVATESDCKNKNSSMASTSIQSASSEAVTWSVGLNWQMTDDIYSYIVTRRGYRAGAINSPILVGRMAKFQGLDPEYVDDYEIGLRADWDVGKLDLRTNISAYIGEYDDVQVALSGLNTSGTCNPAISNNPPGISPDGDCDKSNDPSGGTLMANLGASEVSGVDFEIVAVADVTANSNLTLNLGGSYMHAKTKELSAPPELKVYLATNEIPFNFTPDMTVTAGLRYQILTDNRFASDIVYNVDYYWTDDFRKGEAVLDGYDVTNMRLDINNVLQSKFTLGLYIRNVFEDEYFATAAAGGARIGFFSALYGPPRMYGAEIKYEF